MYTSTLTKPGNLTKCLGGGGGGEEGQYLSDDGQVFHLRGNSRTPCCCCFMGSKIEREERNRWQLD